MCFVNNLPTYLGRYLSFQAPQSALGRGFSRATYISLSSPRGFFYPKLLLNCTPRRNLAFRWTSFGLPVFLTVLDGRTSIFIYEATDIANSPDSSAGEKGYDPREPSTTSLVPRRATSSGAAFVKKRNAQNRFSSVEPGSSGVIYEARPEQRRAFSSEWEAPRGGKTRETSLASVVAPELPEIRKNSPVASRPLAPALAPSPLPNSMPSDSIHSAPPRTVLSPSIEKMKGPGEVSRALAGPDVYEGGRKRKNSRWNRMSSWVRKLKAH